jgi:hypothetical protein
LNGPSDYSTGLPGRLVGWSVVLLALACSACAPSIAPPTAAATPVPAAAVAAVSEGGRLPTRLAPSTPSPSPTTDLGALIVTVQPFLTRTPGPITSPTPPLIPPLTSTPRPTNTRPSGSFPDRVLTAPTRIPTATRTPAPRGTFVGVPPEVALPAPTEPVPDPNEPNDSIGQASPLGASPIQGAIGGPGDVDVFRIDVAEANQLLVVTLSGAQANRYKLDVVAPRAGNVGRQRLEGTVAVRALAEVGSDTGSYYVYVRAVGRELPQGPYFISAEIAPPAVTPTSTE